MWYFCIIATLGILIWLQTHTWMAGFVLDIGLCFIDAVLNWFGTWTCVHVPTCCSTFCFDVMLKKCSFGKCALPKKLVGEKQSSGKNTIHHYNMFNYLPLPVNLSSLLFIFISDSRVYYQSCDDPVCIKLCGPCAYRIYLLLEIKCHTWREISFINGVVQNIFVEIFVENILLKRFCFHIRMKRTLSFTSGRLWRKKQAFF